MHHLFSFLWENASCLLKLYHNPEGPLVSSPSEEEGRCRNCQYIHDNLDYACTLSIQWPRHIQALFLMFLFWFFQDTHWNYMCSLYLNQPGPIVLAPILLACLYCIGAYLICASITPFFHQLQVPCCIGKNFDRTVDIVNQVPYLTEFVIVIHSCMIIASEKCHDCPEPVSGGNHTTSPVAIVQ